MLNTEDGEGMMNFGMLEVAVMRAHTAKSNSAKDTGARKSKAVSCGRGITRFTLLIFSPPLLGSPGMKCIGASTQGAVLETWLQNPKPDLETQKPVPKHGVRAARAMTHPLALPIRTLTVGTGISPVRSAQMRRFADFTAGADLHSPQS